MAAVTASLVFALSGGVAIADEVTATAQPTAEAAAQGQVTTETQTTGAEDATTGAATGGSAVGQAQDNGEASQQAAEKEEVDGAKADEAGVKDGQQADESKPSEAADAQKADGAKTDGTADVKDTAGSGEATATADDVALEAQVATMWKRGDIFVNNGGFAESNDAQADESKVEWMVIEADVPSDMKYVDEDGYRMFYGGVKAKVGGKSQSIYWAKIGDNGELLFPADQSKSAPLSYINTENYKLLNSINFPATRLLHYDAVKDALVPYNGGYYYPGGEYGAPGIFYYSSTSDREAGLLTHANQGGLPNSGTSAVGPVATAPITASLSNYESGTATATPATGTAYVSPTAAETTPATSDATSLAGAAAAAISALGAFVGAKAIRRK